MPLINYLRINNNNKTTIIMYIQLKQLTVFN